MSKLSIIKLQMDLAKYNQRVKVPNMISKLQVLHQVKCIMFKYVKNHNNIPDKFEVQEWVNLLKN